MRKTKSKEIRKSVGYDPKNPNPVLKKVYRRAKKAYSKLNKNNRSNFIYER